jgi:hypothetical protein
MRSLRLFLRNELPQRAESRRSDMKNAKLSHIIQLGIVVPDRGKAVENFCKLFAVDDDDVMMVETEEDGLTETTHYEKDVEFSLNIALVNYCGMQFEFIEPAGGDENPYSEYLKRNGPGIHHINVMFEDYSKSIEAIKKAGGKVMTKGKLYGAEYIYMDLLEQMGLVFETAEDIGEELCQSILES